MGTAPDSMRAWSVGLDMVYSAGGMLLLGAGIDWLAGTRPWWMLGLGLLGLVVGMYRFIRDAVRMNTQTSGRRPSPRRSPGGAGPGGASTGQRGTPSAAGGGAKNPAGQEKAGPDGSSRR